MHVKCVPEIHHKNLLLLKWYVQHEALNEPLIDDDGAKNNN